MKLTTREIVIFPMLAAVMYVSKLLMEAFPNIHLLGVFVVAITVVYRRKALYPIYLFVLLMGLFNGFNTWWIPYLYIWTVLWGMTMLVPKNLPKRWQPLAYMGVCSLHGFVYGILYAPAQALIFGLSFEGMLAWIVAGFPWDIIHGISNFICASILWPIVYILRLGEKNIKNL